MRRPVHQAAPRGEGGRGMPRPYEARWRPTSIGRQGLVHGRTNVDDEGFVESSGEIAGGAGERYAHLGQRAAAFVRAAGGAVPEDALIVHVFGSMGTPALWRPLLRRFLGDDGDLTLRADGCWALPHVATSDDSSLLPEFAAVDVETTGLR